MFLKDDCLATSITVPADQVVKIPDALSFADAASMPRAYCTAIYSLTVVGNVRRGQTILIHEATSSVGLAAIILCQLLGLEIYCTVTSPDQAEHITTAFSIAPSHIFAFGDTSFQSTLMATTRNRGVDNILLDLPSADLLQASWNCVASRGKVRTCICSNQGIALSMLIIV
jgi:NADPH:quinone reductase-like Zn-dependent oxidoreductase